MLGLLFGKTASTRGGDQSGMFRCEDSVSSLVAALSYSLGFIFIFTNSLPGPVCAQGAPLFLFPEAHSHPRQKHFPELRRGGLWKIWAFPIHWGPHSYWLNCAFCTGFLVHCLCQTLVPELCLGDLKQWPKLHIQQWRRRPPTPGLIVLSHFQPPVLTRDIRAIHRNSWNILWESTK